MELSLTGAGFPFVNPHSNPTPFTICMRGYMPIRSKENRCPVRRNTKRELTKAADSYITRGMSSKTYFIYISERIRYATKNRGMKLVIEYEEVISVCCPLPRP